MKEKKGMKKEGEKMDELESMEEREEEEEEVISSSPSSLEEKAFCPLNIFLAHAH